MKIQFYLLILFVFSIFAMAIDTNSSLVSGFSEKSCFLQDNNGSKGLNDFCLELANKYNNLAFESYKDYDFNKSAYYLQKAVAIDKRVSNGDLALSRSYALLSLTNFKDFNFSKAKDYFNLSLNIEKSLDLSRYSNSSIDISDLYRNLAVLHFYLENDIDTFEEYYSKAIDILKDSKYKSDREKLYLVYYDMGKLIISVEGDYRRGVELLEKSVKSFNPINRRAKLLYESKVYGDIVDICSDEEDFECSKSYLKRLIPINISLYGKDSPLVIDVYYGISFAYLETKDFNLAKEYMEKILNIYKKRQKSRSRELKIAYVYGNLGVIAQDAKDYDNAKIYYKKAIDIYNRFNSKDLNNTINYNNLALISLESGEYNKSIEYFKKSLSIKEEILGEDSIETLEQYSIMALVYKDLKEYGKAIFYLEKILNTNKKRFGEDSLNSIYDYYNIGLVYADMKKFDMAKEYLQKSLTLKIRILFGDERLEEVSNKLALFSINEYKKIVSFSYDKLDEFLDNIDFFIRLKDKS